MRPVLPVRLSWISPDCRLCVGNRYSTILSHSFHAVLPWSISAALSRLRSTVAALRRSAASTSSIPPREPCSRTARLRVQAELDAAVSAARAAQSRLAARSDLRSGRLSSRNAPQRLKAHQAPLARLLTQEQGKPLGQSMDEIDRAASLSVGMTKISITPEVIVDNAERYIELRYLPLGVAGIITPWNAPVNLAIGPLASALYTGNCAIVKPSPFTPLTTLRIGELLRTILPAGVVNVLAGGDELGALLTTHPGIDKISFTGSVATGKKVMASASGTLKRVTLELGGNDAAIVLEDVDVKAVAKKLFFAATVNSGQVCMAIKRIYAHESVYDALCTALIEEARSARLGDGQIRGHHAGSDPEPAAVRTRRRAHGGCAARGRHGHARQCSAGWQRIFREPHHRHRPARIQPPRGRRAVRPGVSRHEVPGRGGCDPPRERHPFRPRGLGVESRPRPCPENCRASGSRHRVGEPASRHHGHGAIRRREGIRAWDVRIPAWASRLTSNRRSSAFCGNECLSGIGGPCAIRTRDQLVKSQLLYRLS